MSNALKTRPPEDREKDNNPIDDDYKDKFNELTDPEHYSKNGINPRDKDIDLSKAEDSAANPLSSDRETNEKPKSLYAGKPSANSKWDRLAKGARIAFSGKRKYGWGVAGGVTGILIVFTMLLPNIGPVHMMDAINGFHYAANSRSRTIRSARFVKRVLSGEGITKRGSVSKRLDNVDSVELREHLSKRGLVVQYDGSKPVSLLDTSTGKTTDISSRKAVNLLDDALPSVRSSQRGSFNLYAKIKANFNWTSRFKTISGEDSFWKNNRKLRRNGADGDTASKTAVTDENRVVDTNGEPVADADAARASSATEEGVRVTNERLLAGDSDAVSLRAGTKAASTFNAPSPKSLVIGSFIISCTVKAVYDNELQTKYYGYQQAMTEGIEGMMIADEIKNGNPKTADDVGEFFSKYNNKDGTFASSSGWQSINGQTVTAPGMNMENDISGQYSPADYLGQILGLMQGAGGVVNKVPGLSQSCGVFNTVAGTVVGSLVLTGIDAFATAAEIIAACNPFVAVGTGGTACAAKLATQTFFFTVLPRLMALVVNSGVSKIIDNPEQAFNFLTHASALVSGEMNRTGKPVSEAEYRKVVSNYLKEESQLNDNLLDRYFAMDNQQSLTRFLATWKTNFLNESNTQRFASIISLPNKMLGSIVSIFSGDTILAQELTASGSYVDPHSSIQRYALDNEWSDVDEEEVERLALDLIDTNEVAKATARYCMGYDNVSGSVKPEYQLPLFSNPGAEDSGEETNGLVGFFSDLNNSVFKSSDAQRDNDRVQDYCINFKPSTVTSSGERNVNGAGITRSQYALIGRYVDDIKILDGMIDLLSPSVPAGSTIAVDNTDLVTSGTTQELAQQILDIADSDGNISFLYGSRGFTFVPAADGKPGVVNDPKATVVETPVNANLLRLILSISNSNVVSDLRLGSVTSGEHQKGSAHFKGLAVDINTSGMKGGAKGNEAEALYMYLYSNSKYAGGNLCIGSLIYANEFSGSNLLNGKPGNKNPDGHTAHIHVSIKESGCN